MAAFGVGDDSSAATYLTRVLPGLTLTAKKQSGKVTFTVADAGDPVKGATVKAGGKSGKTDGKGRAVLAIKGKATAQATANGLRACNPQAEMSYSVLPAGEAFWRPSNQMGVLNTDLAKQLGRDGPRRALLAAAPRAGLDQAPARETHELYVVIEGTGRIRIDDDLIELPRLSSLLVTPDSVRQVFNDTDADVLWLVFGAPNEAANTLEMSEETMAFLYPDGPKALPPELAP